MMEMEIKIIDLLSHHNEDDTVIIQYAAQACIDFSRAVIFRCKGSEVRKKGG